MAETLWNANESLAIFENHASRSVGLDVRILHGTCASQLSHL
jgi:hypothetical protein